VSELPPVSVRCCSGGVDLAARVTRDGRIEVLCNDGEWRGLLDACVTRGQIDEVLRAVLLHLLRST
jgi:hypothetical protein